MAFAFGSPADRPVLNLFSDRDFARQRAFFNQRHDLHPTPLHRLSALARQLGLDALSAKDETARYGLNAFKSVGTVFAVGILAERGDIRAGDTLVAASEGNHGRAVARAASDLECRARVYMAESVAAVRKAAIESEGATVVSVPGSYDDAVRVMLAEAAAHGWTVISDTSCDEDDEVPRLIVLGYTRLLDEAADAWSPDGAPDTIFVQGGVGGLLAAVACWAQWRYGAARPRVVCVEPVSAACLQVSARNGAPTTLAGPFDTVMTGLRAGEVSRVGFRAVRSLVDAFVAIEDDWAFEAIRLLAGPTSPDPVIRAGASGAAALGGLIATLRDPALANFRRQLELGPESRVLVLVTEGVTDPAVFQKAVQSQ